MFYYDNNNNNNNNNNGDKEKRKVIIIDVAILNTYNMMETIVEKQRKYCELQQEIKRMREVENATWFHLSFQRLE